MPQLLYFSVSGAHRIILLSKQINICEPSSTLPYRSMLCNSYYDSYNYYFHGLSKIINANFCFIFFHDLKKRKFSFQCNDRRIEETRTYKYILNGHG